MLCFINLYLLKFISSRKTEQFVWKNIFNKINYNKLFVFKPLCYLFINSDVKINTPFIDKDNFSYTAPNRFFKIFLMRRAYSFSLYRCIWLVMVYNRTCTKFGTNRIHCDTWSFAFSCRPKVFGICVSLFCFKDIFWALQFIIFCIFVMFLQTTFHSPFYYSYSIFSTNSTLFDLPTGKSFI